MLKNIQILTLFLLTTFLSGCGAIEMVFKAGMWWAFFLVFLVVFIIGWFILRKKK